jgi:polyhydroxybutyrate depolymerase
VVTPSALGTPAGWNLFQDPGRADDYGFIDALIDDLDQRLCIDHDRIRAVGHSNGSAFAGLIVCQPPYRFSAAVMVAAFIPPGLNGCPDDVIPSVLAFHGTADPGIPYEGGYVRGLTLEGEFFVPGVLDTLDDFADHFGCKPKLKEKRVAGDVIRHSYSKKCADRVQVMLYSILGWGHAWPSLPDFSATDAILDFFDRDKSAGRS